MLLQLWSKFYLSNKIILFIFFFDLSKDIWSSNTALSNNTRSLVSGLSNTLGICTSNRYSIIEEIGFNNAHNAAHELGHRYTYIYMAYFFYLH